MLMLISRWVDQMGNVHGRVDSVEGMNANAAALLIGSHLVMLNLFSLFFIKKKKICFNCYPACKDIHPQRTC
jgi:hypothetical protein